MVCCHIVAGNYPLPSYISVILLPSIAVQGKIQILEDQSATSELGAFRDLEMFTGGQYTGGR